MIRRVLALLCLTATIALAQQPSDRFYAAIRGNDLPALRGLLKEQGPNVPDTRGHTPLMIAAAYGSLESFKLLLDAGADAKAVSELGETALHWSAGDIKKVRLLLAKGADLNAKSKMGRTPLLVASATHGASEVVKTLLARGAEVAVADAEGITSLQAAAASDDLDSVRFLLERGAEPNTAATTGMTALMHAATNGNVEMARLLIAHKADPNAASGETNGPPVKNGLTAIGFMTPLHWAAVSGGPEMVKLLLDAGAKVDKLDIRGMTALMSSVALDDARPETVRMLLEKGSDPNIKSKAGETTLDWARKFNNPAVLPLLKLASQAPQPVLTSVADASPASPRQAVERALPPLQHATDYVFKDSGCIACHAQPVTEMAVNLARSRGWRVDEALSKQSLDSMIRANFTTQGPRLLQGLEGGGLPDNTLYGLLSLAANKIAPNAGTDAVVHYLIAKQHTAGYWAGGTAGSRAPIQDGHFSRTAMGIRALSVYGIPARKAEFDERIARAAKWLATQTPFATEPRVMQLMGLYWANSEPKLQATRTKELLAQQRTDGGWGQSQFLEGDAYATGQVLYALHELGTPASDPSFRRGVDFLLRTQKTDGTWYVKNRAMKLQPYFESGFPYEHDQWISSAATAWASMALSLSEPERSTTAATVR